MSLGLQTHHALTTLHMDSMTDTFHCGLVMADIMIMTKEHGNGNVRICLERQKIYSHKRLLFLISFLCFKMQEHACLHQENVIGKKTNISLTMMFQKRQTILK